MFNKILIANRGEIACRVINTARRLGIKTVAVYSDVDANAKHVRMADQAVHIGAAPSQESYLNIERIIYAARSTNAQAIHPGYGFLSENANFAQSCIDNKLVFIGPPASAIATMGSKSAAKSIMQQAAVPLVPGYHGKDQSAAILKQAADEIGYPVLLKAVAGGGGKGMRQVHNKAEFASALADAKGEAKASFDNDDMLVEKYLTRPRHIEVQVFCDTHGNGVYLFERDCSIQRRHQKIIEEAPAPGLSESQRAEMGAAAVTAAKAIDYVGAGTVEFLFDEDGAFYFMEMNTRLQVEHPVTEMITGQDLVEWQLQVANGEPLPCQQNELSINGHAFEARIYAENPADNFIPTSGTVTALHTPEENATCRIDSGVDVGDAVSPYYDPMISKLIVCASDRQQALNKLQDALAQYQLLGVNTNIDFLHRVASHKAFAAAQLSTNFIEQHQPDLLTENTTQWQHAAIQAACFIYLYANQTTPQSPWDSKIGWRLNQDNTVSYDLLINETPACVSVNTTNKNTLTVTFDDTSQTISAQLNNHLLTTVINGLRQSCRVIGTPNEFCLFADGHSITVTRPTATYTENTRNQISSNQAFIAPMNGTVVEVCVKNGETVKQGQRLMVIEAMKMQHSISAPEDGIIDEIFFKTGDLVDGGAELLGFTKNEP